MDGRLQVETTSYKVDESDDLARVGCFRRNAIRCAAYIGEDVPFGAMDQCPFHRMGGN